MIQEEINALKLGAPAYDTSSRPTERILWYTVIDCWGEQFNAAKIVGQSRDRWSFRVDGKAEYEGIPLETFETPAKALVALKNWLTDNRKF